ncbi:MAG: RodZ domain-containing protein, partial [bacterium]
RGFIKKYALYLGLNSDELLAQHQGEKSLLAQKQQMDAIIQQKAESSPERSISLQRYIFLIAVIILCFGIFVSLLFLTKKKPPVYTEAKETEAKRFLSTIQQKSDKRVPLELKITSMRSSWIRVESDGMMVYEGNLPVDIFQHWKAKKKFKIIAENWDHISITLNGDTIELRPEDKNVHDLILDRSDIGTNLES